LPNPKGLHEIMHDQASPGSLEHDRGRRGVVDCLQHGMANTS
jgi:hypothetical protein